MHLIIIQLQRQCPPTFGRFSSVKNYSPIHIFHQKNCMMTLTSMHPMFQVLISNECKHGKVDKK